MIRDDELPRSDDGIRRSEKSEAVQRVREAVLHVRCTDRDVRRWRRAAGATRDVKLLSHWVRTTLNLASNKAET